MAPLTLAVWLAPLAGAAEPLHSFQAIFAALDAGESVRVVVHLGSCLRDSEPGPAGTIGFSIDRFEAVEKGAVGNPNGFLLAAHEAVTLHPSGQVRTLTRLKLFDDDRAEVIVREVDPKSNKRKSEDVYNCGLGSGIALYSGR